MKPDIEQADRALFVGDRGKVLRLLHGQPQTAQELWLVAAAVEDVEERHRLLRQVARLGQAPYASKARDILARESDFDAEMNQMPGWQAWLIRHQARLIDLIVVVAVLCGVFLLFLIFQG